MVQPLACRHPQEEDHAAGWKDFRWLPVPPSRQTATCRYHWKSIAINHF